MCLIVKTFQEKWGQSLTSITHIFWNPLSWYCDDKIDMLWFNLKDPVYFPFELIQTHKKSLLSKLGPWSWGTHLDPNLYHTIIWVTCLYDSVPKPRRRWRPCVIALHTKHIFMKNPNSPHKNVATDSFVQVLIYLVSVIVKVPNKYIMTWIITLAKKILLQNIISIPRGHKLFLILLSVGCFC